MTHACQVFREMLVIKFDIFSSFFEAMVSNIEYIYKHYVESSDEEAYVDETAMMQTILEEAKHAEERVLNFKDRSRVIEC